MLAHSHIHWHGPDRKDNHVDSTGKPFGKDHAHKHSDDVSAVKDAEHTHPHGHSDVEVTTDPESLSPEVYTAS